MLDDACSTNRSDAGGTHAEAMARFHLRLRMNPSWMGSFVRRNVVPVGCNGHPFLEYRYKLREMLRAVDSAAGVADPEIAHLSYEGWMH